GFSAESHGIQQAHQRRIRRERRRRAVKVGDCLGATMPILRSEVYFVELGPTRGKELDLKRRPVVVVSTNDINRKPLVITVVPGKTHKPQKQVFRNEVKVEPSPDNGLEN